MLPIRTNIWPRRPPYANYALIGITAVAFMLTYQPHEVLIYHQGIGQKQLVSIAPFAQAFQLVPNAWRIWQFVTYAFLHGGYWHIIGNMFFLYLFGNNVNDRLGHTRYLVFYLAGAVLSGAGHALINPSSPIPTVGASGAVAAVTGAYLVLFPRSLITVLYFFIFIGTVEVRALWFILLKMILIDNWLAAGSSHVAYDAHLAGYAAGIFGTLLMLRRGWIHREGYDLWLMIQQWNRRRTYQNAVSDGYNPFTGTGVRRSVEAREVAKTPEQQRKEARIQQLRAEISQWLMQHNVATAAQSYIDLMAIDEAQILARQPLLDIANQLASESRYSEAARAYEQILTHFQGYDHLEQVMLMLGLIYARYLRRPKRAKEVLNQALARLTDPNQQAMCRQELARLTA